VLGCRRAYRGWCAQRRAELASDVSLAAAAAVAALWLAIKFAATRTTVPDSQLMYHVSGEHQKQIVVAD
jgi:hypothetical protein